MSGTHESRQTQLRRGPRVVVAGLAVVLRRDIVTAGPSAVTAVTRVVVTATFTAVALFAVAFASVALVVVGHNQTEQNNGKQAQDLRIRTQNKR